MDAVVAGSDRVAADWDSNPTRGGLARADALAIGQTAPLNPDMTVLDFPWFGGGSTWKH